MHCPNASNISEYNHKNDTHEDINILVKTHLHIFIICIIVLLVKYSV